MVTSGKLGQLYSLGLLLLAAAHFPVANGQQVGVSLKVQGVIVPNNSLVDFDDILYRTRYDPLRQDPSNANGLHDQTLVCITDLVDCCGVPRTVRGDWYYPDGSKVQFETNQYSTFRRNRDPNQVISLNGTRLHVYGSVRLFRRYHPTERGRFRCELPSSANPRINQTLYANIVDFDPQLNPVTISSSGSNTAGENYTLMCSATLVDPIPLPANIPSPTFEWFFGTNGNALLPSGVTPMATAMSSTSTSITYNSTLLFSPLSQSHAGMYTCRLGAGRLANSSNVTVNVPPISVQIVRQKYSSYPFTCNVSVAENLNSTITYQWTKNNGTQIEVGINSKTLSFPHLRLSDAGQYSCQATVTSPYLNCYSGITINSQDIVIQVPVASNVNTMLHSNVPNNIPPGSDVTLTCSVQLQSRPESNYPLTVNLEISRSPWSPLPTSPLSVSGSTYTTTATITSFGRDQSGNYICRATISPASPNAFFTNHITTSRLRVTTGVYLVLRGHIIANNSQINILSIGQSSDDPNSALQCITDRTPCCLSEDPRYGEWYLPNGESVLGNTSTTVFYRNKGSNGEVSLNRPNNVELPTGLFCCKVAEATNYRYRYNIQTLCVNIGTISITASGSPTAGESYTLECSAGGSVATFSWLGPPFGIIPFVESSSRSSVSNSTTSQLQFRPLQQSHNGSYSCSVSTGGQNLISQPIVVSVNVPSVTVEIIDSGATPTAGVNYQLVCSVSVTENLSPTITYQWTKNNGGQTQVGTILSFTPLRLLDAANYACMTTIGSSNLVENITAMNSQDINVQIPTPSSVTLTSSESNSLHIVGSDTILTCTVKLNSAIVESDLSLLMVDAQLSRDGTPLALTGPTVTGTTFTYTTQLNSFGRSDSGNYTCTATVRPQPSSSYLYGTGILSNTITLKAASAPPLNVQATQSSSSAPVEVSWSPPSHGATNITGYRIFYGSGKSILVPSVIIYVGLMVYARDYVVSIRSESDQLYSELIDIHIISVTHITGASDTKVQFSSCANEIGIAVGAVMVVVCLIVMAITIFVLCCLCRKKPSSKNNCAVSANMAYDGLNFKPGGIGAEYEDPDMTLKSSHIQWTDTTAAVYETVSASNPAAPEYINTAETAFATSSVTQD